MPGDAPTACRAAGWSASATARGCVGTDVPQRPIRRTLNEEKEDTSHEHEEGAGGHDRAGAARDLADGRVETLSASASVSDGVCHVSLTNTDLERPVDVTIEVRGSRVGVVGGRLLAPGTVGAFNASGHLEDVAPRPVDELVVTPSTVRITLPPHSFAVVRAELPGLAAAH